MANDVSGRQWILNTASATPLAHHNVKIVEGFWMNAMVGATLQFMDLSGRTFNYTNYQLDYPFPIGKLDWLNGFILTQISSGTLYLIIGK